MNATCLYSISTHSCSGHYLEYLQSVRGRKTCGSKLYALLLSLGVFAPATADTLLTTCTIIPLACQGQAHRLNIISSWIFLLTSPVLTPLGFNYPQQNRSFLCNSQRSPSRFLEVEEGSILERSNGSRNLIRDMSNEEALEKGNASVSLFIDNPNKLSQAIYRSNTKSLNKLIKEGVDIHQKFSVSFTQEDRSKVEVTALDLAILSRNSSLNLCMILAQNRVKALLPPICLPYVSIFLTKIIRHLGVNYSLENYTLMVEMILSLIVERVPWVPLENENYQLLKGYMFPITPLVAALYQLSCVIYLKDSSAYMQGFKKIIVALALCGEDFQLSSIRPKMHLSQVIPDLDIAKGLEEFYNQLPEDELNFTTTLLTSCQFPSVISSMVIEYLRKPTWSEMLLPH